MNSLDLQTKRNNTRRYFRHQSGIHVNCIRLNITNSYSHEMKKVDICMEMLKRGQQFLVEAEFERPFKKRADLVCLDTGTVYEIQGSESNESIEEKKKTYPLPIVVIRC